MAGIVVFGSVVEALRAGFTMYGPYPDSEGNLRAWIQTPNGKADALVRVGRPC